MKRWAVITGGGAGIGAALTKYLVERDFNVLVVDTRLEPMVELQKTSPAKISILHADIAEKDTPARIDLTIPAEDHVVLVVQNAAVAKSSVFGTMERGELDYFFAVNVIAPLMLAQKLYPRLRVSNGRILHIGTGLAHRPEVGYTAYCLTKGAYYRLYEQLKAEFANSGVSVGSIKTGAVDTESFWKGHEEATHHKLPMVELENRVINGGMLFKPEETARLLGYMLLDTTDEAFSKEEWNAYDKSHWSHWRQP